MNVFRKNQSCSLETMILQLARIHIAAAVGICLSMLIWEYYILAEIRGTMENSTEYFSYYELAEQMDQALTRFVHMQDIKQRDSCADLSGRLLQSAESLRAAYEDAEFQDHYYLTESYLEAVGQLLEIHSPRLSEEEISQYTYCQRIYRYILDNQKTLSQVCTAEISKECRRMFRLWRGQFLFNGGIVICSALFLIRICRNMAGRIARPLEELTRQAQAFAEGERPGQKVGEGGIRVKETEVLYDAFFHMAETIQRQMEQLIQSMISPHFLFNCLGTLSALAYFEHAPRTRKASLQISGYLRKSLDLVGKEIPLAEEMQHAREYIAIQQLRFEDRIRFETGCDPSCLGFLIPAMVLQPLIENSIQHGLKSRTKGGVVKAFLGEEDGEIVISVSDNGSGMERERLEDIKRSMGQPFEPQKHRVGLHSISTRIQSRFGERARILVESIPENGTCVCIRIQR